MPQALSIADIIQQRLITSVFQPIIDIESGLVRGYEGLSRGPSDSPLFSPLNLFAEAEKHDLVHDLEKVCLQSLIRRFSALNLDGKLFVNVSQDLIINATSLEEKLDQLLDLRKISASNMVIELTEHSESDDINELKRATEFFHNKGFQIAIDDLGAGYSSLRLWSETKPDYVKIDRHFITDIDTDQTKQEFVRSIVEIALGTRTQVIAEGVETLGEFEKLRSIGLKLFQGFLFAKPEATPDALDLSAYLPDKPPLDNEFYLTAQLVYSYDHAEPKARVHDVVTCFQNNVALNSVTIVDEGKPVGIVHRKRFLTDMSRPYAMELSTHKTIDSIMDKDFLMVDARCKLEQASRLVTARARIHAEEDFVITERGAFLGQGQVIDLLRQITEIQVKTARHANPLTMLPGNIPIGDCVERLLLDGSSFVVSYIDIDNFKPFNDYYGYAKGDQILVFLATTLKKYFSHVEDFIGHVGGDDFISVTTNENWSDALIATLKEFNHKLPEFYSPEDQEKGGIQAQDRFGDIRFFDFMSLSIGSIKIDPNRYGSFQEISTELVNVKQRAKSNKNLEIVYRDREGIHEFMLNQEQACLEKNAKQA